jgi:hypothetical protein
MITGQEAIQRRSRTVSAGSLIRLCVALADGALGCTHGDQSGPERVTILPFGAIPLVECCRSVEARVAVGVR